MGGKESSISEVKMGDLQVVEAEQNTAGRQILAKQFRNNGTQRVSR